MRWKAQEWANPQSAVDLIPQPTHYPAFANILIPCRSFLYAHHAGRLFAQRHLLVLMSVIRTLAVPYRVGRISLMACYCYHCYLFSYLLLCTHQRWAAYSCATQSLVTFCRHQY